MNNQDPASKIVPDEIIDAAVTEINEFSDNEGKRFMDGLSRRQPALLAFVTASSEDLTPDASELAIFIFVVIVRTFEMHFGKRLQNVGMKRIESIYEENEKMMEQLVGAQHGALESFAGVQIQKQPWVWKYVVESIFEVDDPEIHLSQDDIGSLAIIMKTVIDALDGSVR